MAEKTLSKTNTTRTKKTTTKKEVEEVKEIDEAVEVEKKEIKSAKAKKKFESEDGIPCRSVTEGLLLVTGMKSGMTYRFPEYGTEVDIEYRDLEAIVKSKIQLVQYPFFVILDDDFVDQFRVVKEFYESNYPLDDLRGILSKPVDEMISVIKKLPKGAVDSLKNMVATDVSLGRINEIDRLNALNDFYDVDFQMINEVFGEG